MASTLIYVACLTPAKFEFAPLLVSTNCERFDFTQYQALRYAKARGTYVIRWRLKLVDWKGRPKEYEQVIEDDPILHRTVGLVEK